jgi:hypothetical protein
VKSAQQAGFVLDTLLLQMPARNSLKSYLHYEKSPVGDYYLRFKKTPSPLEQKKRLTVTDLNALIETTVIGILEERGESTNISFIYNCIDEQLAKFGNFPLEDPSIIYKTIESMKNSNRIVISDKFTINLSHTGKKKKPSLQTRIMKFLKNSKDVQKLSYSDIFNLIYKKYNGWNTPDRRILSQIIDEIKKS